MKPIPPAYHWIKIVCILLLAGPLLSDAEEPTYHDQPMSYWVKLLGSQDLDLRLEAAMILGRRIGKPALPGLIKALQDTRSCEGAARALRYLGAEAAEAEEPLLEALKSRVARDPGELIDALSSLPPRSKESYQVLLNIVKGEDPNRLHALSALEAMGHLAEEAVPVLVDIVKRESGIYLLRALAALAAVDPNGKVALPVLEEILRGPNMGSRRSAILVLGHMKTKARKAAPAISRELEAEDHSVRMMALEALAQIDPPDLQDQIISKLKDDRIEVRMMTAEILSRFHAHAKEVMPVLKEGLLHSDKVIRWKAALAAESYAKDATELVPELIKALGDAGRDVRSAAISALGKMGPDAKAAVASLTVILSDPDKYLRGHAAHALGRIGPGAKDALPALQDMFMDPDSTVRLFAKIAISEISKP